MRLRFGSTTKYLLFPTRRRVLRIVLRRDARGGAFENSCGGDRQSVPVPIAPGSSQAVVAAHPDRVRNPKKSHRYRRPLGRRKMTPLQSQLSLEPCFKSVRDSQFFGVSEGLDGSIHHATIWNAASAHFRSGRVANNFQKRHKSFVFCLGRGDVARSPLKSISAQKRLA
jgi:hypothetical protein